MLSRQPQVRLSRFLSRVLRHRPETIGIELDPAGWVEVEALLAGCRRAGRSMSRVQLEEVVAANDKRRFEFSADGTRIRASQGHSVPVELGYRPVEPPEVLYHGTAERNLAAIREQGLVKGGRHHVHLSPDAGTAAAVGRRHGREVVIEVLAGRMHQDGYLFFLSANGVWLTDHVPARYLAMSDD